MRVAQEEFVAREEGQRWRAKNLQKKSVTSHKHVQPAEKNSEDSSECSNGVAYSEFTGNRPRRACTLRIQLDLLNILCCEPKH